MGHIAHLKQDVFVPDNGQLNSKDGQGHKDKYLDTSR